ncbi:acyltransferase family protein [Martelella endophytica]|uniref:Acyltransferase 3 domain-containing protein n=1 Tax=Martelella endophytica TaxID=1486262 RepID=A0A0D5LSC1_MAREN|nr:acyltransferase [Martelella endophytica]AJY46976.1 hypothetical protein TM49_16855 [Martelella endophytica]
MKKNIESVQVLRGLAALAVVCYHTYIILMEPQYGSHVVFQGFAKYGFLGVSFFFVLSGFIIYLAHDKDLGVPSSVPTYIYKRAARVYPAYWVYLTLFLLAAAVGIGYPDFSWHPINLISSYILFPLDGGAISLPLKVAWTLVYEVRFYLLFIVLLLFGRRALWGFVGWAGVIIVGYFAGWFLPFDLLSLWNLYFLMGMLGFVLLKHIPERLGAVVFMAGMLLFVLYAVLGSEIIRIANLSEERFSYLHFILGPSFWCIIIGAILIERRYALRYPSLLRFFGDASYSVYLVHSAVISVLTQISMKFGVIDAIGPHAYFLVAFLIAASAGGVAYRLVEQPLIGVFARLRTS